MGQTPGKQFWWVPWVVPLVIVAVVVAGALLPFWAFALAGGIVVAIALLLVLRFIPADYRVTLPGWLPGGRPGDR